jgi:ABC-2 type transport system ATP-binding protein
MSMPYLDEAERCTRVALLHEGRVLAIDEPARLRDLMPGRIVEMMAGHTPGLLEIVRRMPGVQDAQVFGERVHVRLGDTADEAVDRFVSALQGTPLEHATVRPVPPSLEDVFIAQLAEETGK